jgi:hypothetical protein
MIGEEGSLPGGLFPTLKLQGERYRAGSPLFLHIAKGLPGDCLH